MCVDLSGYVQELNTHFGIYSALVRSLEQHDAAAGAAAAAAAGAAGRGAAALAGAVPRTAPGGGGFTPEALLVGRMLRRDFERYGVHLPGERRDRMAALVQRGHQLGMAITQNVVDPRQLGTLELRGPLAGGCRRARRMEGVQAAHLPPWSGVGPIRRLIGVEPAAREQPAGGRIGAKGAGCWPESRRLASH